MKKILLFVTLIYWNFALAQKERPFYDRYGILISKEDYVHLHDSLYDVMLNERPLNIQQSIILTRMFNSMPPDSVFSRKKQLKFIHVYFEKYYKDIASLLDAKDFGGFNYSSKYNIYIYGNPVDTSYNNSRYMIDY